MVSHQKFSLKVNTSEVVLIFEVLLIFEWALLKKSTIGKSSDIEISMKCLNVVHSAPRNFKVGKSSMVCMVLVN